VFALMGLRQLYFLLGDLLKRLVYLSIGLSVVLAFIGVKLVLHAMHVNELPFINGGHHIEWAPEIPIWFSLGFIIITLGITTVASLRKSRTLEAEAEAEGTATTPEVSPAPAEPELDPKTKAELDAIRPPEPHDSDAKKS
jgi:tellurite resistance protein TerC